MFSWGLNSAKNRLYCTHPSSPDYCPNSPLQRCVCLNTPGQITCFADVLSENRNEHADIKRNNEEIKRSPARNRVIKRGYANISSIDNTLQLSSQLYDQTKSYPKELQKEVPLEGILEQLRKKLAGRGLRGIICFANEFKVLY